MTSRSAMAPAGRLPQPSQIVDKPAGLGRHPARGQVQGAAEVDRADLVAARLAGTPAVRGRYRGSGGDQRAGSPARNTVTAGQPTAAASCAGPESLPTSRAAEASRAANPPREVRPVRSTARAAMAAATAAATGSSPGTPTSTTGRPRAARASPT